MSVLGAVLVGTRAQYWMDISDPPSGGNPLSVTFLENAIEQGNSSATLSSRLGYTTAAPLTFTMSTSAQEPVSRDFTVTGTFSEPVPYLGSSSLEALQGQWSSTNSETPIRVRNGSYVTHTHPGSNIFSTISFRVRPRANFEGTMVIELPIGSVVPQSTGSLGGRSNSRSVAAGLGGHLEFGRCRPDDTAGNPIRRYRRPVAFLLPRQTPRTHTWRTVGSSVRRVTIDAAKRHAQAVGPEFLDNTDAALADADGNVSGHQVSLQEGVNIVKLKVTAENGTERIYTLSIVSNDPPTLAGNIPDQSATEERAFTYEFPEDTFSDPDNHALTYVAKKIDGGDLPAWLTFNSGTRTFSGTPRTGDAGSLSVAVAADDGFADYTGAAFATFDLTVVPPVAPGRAHRPDRHGQRAHAD